MSSRPHGVCEFSELRQALLNLTINSLDAMDAKGKVTLADPRDTMIVIEVVTQAVEWMDTLANAALLSSQQKGNRAPDWV